MTRARVHAILEGEDPSLGRLVAWALNALIIASALVVALETVPELRQCCGSGFRWFEIVVVTVFGVEYALRLWSSPSALRYATSFAGVIDLLAFLPSLLALGTDWQAVRVLRLFRLLRLAKLGRFARANARLVTAFRQVRDEMAIFSAMAALILYLAAVGIYHFEHEAQPDAFGSIPESLWWAVATLTTVGYGDVYPITAGGRIFTGLVLMIGLGIVAVPTALIASAVSERREREEAQAASARAASGDVEERAQAREEASERPADESPSPDAG